MVVVMIDIVVYEVMIDGIMMILLYLLFTSQLLLYYNQSINRSSW